MLLIMGEISRNSVGIPPEVKLFLLMKNKTEEMMSYSSGSKTDFNNEKQKECWGNLPKLLRHPSGS